MSAAPPPGTKREVTARTYVRDGDERQIQMIQVHDETAHVIAYHLTGPTLRDGRPLPPIGEVLRHDGPVVPCEQGLHASVRLIDALGYAPDAACWLHRVELGGTVEHDEDKIAASERTIVQSWPLDLRRVVRLACESAALAAWCARLDLPDLVLAADAADRGDWHAAGDAARAAGYAAWAAAETAAGDAARAAGYAAWAARVAADAADRGDWHAARDAARAAGYAAGDAARDAVRAAARECLEARAVELLCGP